MIYFTSIAIQNEWWTVLTDVNLYDEAIYNNVQKYRSLLRDEICRHKEMFSFAFTAVIYNDDETYGYYMVGTTIFWLSKKNIEEDLKSEKIGQVASPVPCIRTMPLQPLDP